jgi:hypothetical protein
MKKKQHIYQFISFFILTITAILPIPTFAQLSNGQSPWSRDEIRQWRGRSSSLNNKINSLDNDTVENVPLPILFGLTPDNITRNFGDPRSGGRTHEGLDIMAPKRALIVSPTEAVVMRIGVGESAGNYVYTANPGGETFAYMHLDEIADINEGDELAKGGFIGYVGNTGNASGGATHLHFEIHQDGEATDPFPRLKSIFPLEDKIEYLKDILNIADDEKKLAESVVIMYRKELALAQTLNITLPTSISKALASKTAETALIARTLQLGSKGDDVKLLQTALGISTDGSFGLKTKVAVVAFQISKNLTADGVFGPKSRVALAGSNNIGCTSSTKYSPVTGIKCPVV